MAGLSLFPVPNLIQVAPATLETRG